MKHPLYRKITLTTDAGRPLGEMILPQGEGYDGVRIISMPAGLTPAFSFTGSADDTHLIPFAVGEQIRFVDECNNPFLAEEGLILAHNAVIGSIVILVSQGVQR